MGKYIYICSAGHSGSTLLDLLIGSHTKVESLGEITQLPKNISLNTFCTCGEIVSECHMWKNVLNNMGAESGENYFKNPYKLNLGLIGARVIVDRKHQTLWYNIKRRILKGIIYLDMASGCLLSEKIKNTIDDATDNNIKLYNEVKKNQGVDHVVDSTKDYLKAVKLYRKVPDKVKIILLTRNGKGVFYSKLKRNSNKKGSLIGWRNYYKHALFLISKYVPDSKVLRIKYEDLAVNTENVLNKVCEFIGIEYEESMIDFINHTHHITNGNDMRFQKTSEIRIDEQWKIKLKRNEVDLFNKICGNLNKTLGYD